GITEREQDLGDAAHADPADADEVYPALAPVHPGRSLRVEPRPATPVDHTAPQPHHVQMGLQKLGGAVQGAAAIFAPRNPARALRARPAIAPSPRALAQAGVVGATALASLREGERTPRPRGPRRRVGRGLAPVPPWSHVAPDRRSACAASPPDARR